MSCALEASKCLYKVLKLPRLPSALLVFETLVRPKYHTVLLQWNLRIKGTLGPAIMSSVKRFSCELQWNLSLWPPVLRDHLSVKTTWSCPNGSHNTFKRPPVYRNYFFLLTHSRLIQDSVYHVYRKVTAALKLTITRPLVSVQLVSWVTGALKGAIIVDTVLFTATIVIIAFIDIF